jgi:1,4-alpha-glucan branching enzyme
MDYIAPYIHPDGIRKMTGVKYFSITGKTPHKKPYNPHSAYEKAVIMLLISCSTGKSR